MDKKLKRELDQALQGLGNAAVPLRDDQVRDLIGRLEELRRRIVEQQTKPPPR
jgi:hypothetical protein